MWFGTARRPQTVLVQIFSVIHSTCKYLAPEKQQAVHYRVEINWWFGEPPLCLSQVPFHFRFNRPAGTSSAFALRGEYNLYSCKKSSFVVFCFALISLGLIEQYS
jgi:hypothetical protein